MQLSAEHISQFQTIYKEVFGEDISEPDAHKQAMCLIRLVQLTYKPMYKKEVERVKKEILKIRARINKKNNP